MKRVRDFRVLRPVAKAMAALALLLWNAPPAAAFWKRPAAKLPDRTQTPDAAHRKRIDRKEAEARQAPEVRELSDAELGELRGSGPYRNKDLAGTMPWHRSFRDVNLCTGNLFKSFTDLQVQPARGAGLAWQRTYNSNDDREGPFGIGWTHAYDIRIEEGTTPGDVPRSDFFGGKHHYRRDADGLYSPPAYLFDELSSSYQAFLVNGPTEVLSDTQKGMDGTVKHFISGGNDPDGTPAPVRVCDYIEDRHGNRTSFTYGTTITRPDGSTRKLLTSVTDPSGRSLTITWTNLGSTGSPAWRITQVQGPFNMGTPVYTVSYEYDGSYNLWKVHQDPSGLNRVTTFGYTSLSGMSGTESGLLASITDPLGHAVSYSYCLTNPINGTPTLTGSPWVWRVIEPSSPTYGGTHTWNLTWAGGGSPPTLGTTVSSASESGLFLNVLFDSNLRYTYSAINGSNGMVYRREYDSANNITLSEAKAWWKTSAGGFMQSNHRRTSMTYGPHGNVLTQTVEGFTGETTTTSYYNASKYFQKESVTDVLGNVTRIDYFDNADANAGNRGEVKWIRDARYGTTGKQFSFSYNQYGQKTSETNLNDTVTNYSYGDPWGNLTQTVQDPGTGHLNRTTSISYDVAGRVLSSTDPKSQTSSFQYNNVGQPTQATLPGETVTYSYGANGRTESVTDGRGTTTLGYESGCDRVASVTDPVTGAISYTYGRAGERLTAGLPGGGTWTYSYSTNGTYGGQAYLSVPQDDPNSFGKALEKITDDQGRVVDYYLDTQGQPHEVLFDQTFDSSGQKTAYAKTAYTQDLGTSYTHGWLSQIKNTWNVKNPMTGQWTTTTLVQNDYTYSKLGNRLTNQVSDVNGVVRTEQYGYDELSRLTSVNYGDGQTQGYTFDPMGNRLTKTDNVAGNDSYTYNAANMLLTRNGNSYTNDTNGNTLTGGGRTNIWDGQNRLTQCVYNGTTTNHTYGSDGLRRRTVQGASTTDYVHDRSSVVRTLLNGTADRTYLGGPRGPEYERNGTGAPIWYLYDAMGSVLGTIDTSGNTVSTRKYDVYGTLRGSTGPGGTTHKFVAALGHPGEDETGLIYMQARSYDPFLGRFTSQDPSKHGDNWFVYGRNCPTRFADSDGKVEVEEILRLIPDLEGHLYEGMPNGRLTLAMWDAIQNLKAAVQTPSGVAAALGDELDDAMLQVGRLGPVVAALARIRGVMVRGGRIGQLASTCWTAYHSLMGAFGAGRGSLKKL